jgi:tetratricopeptide (TPR) repeat protein
VRYRRARKALADGDARAVVRESRRLLDTAGYEPHGRLLLGLLHAQSRQFSKALYDLQFAARDDATAVEALTVATECYCRLGQPLEATKTARTAIARNAGALEARRWLASAYYDLGAMQDAVAELKVISEQAADDPRPEYLLGLIEKDQERFPEAIVHYRESLRRDARQPNRETILFELAESLTRLKRFDEALDVLRECRQTSPTLTITAECQQNLGRTGEAEILLERARQLDSSYAPASLQLGALFLLLGKADDAAGVLEEAVRLDPQNRQAHFYLAQAYARKHEDVKSAEQLRLTQEIYVAEVEFSELHRTASQQPTDAEVRYRLGVLARRLGKTELARTWFRAALALQPEHSAARAALAELDAPQVPL